jgi:hypothetical protein
MNLRTAGVEAEEFSIYLCGHEEFTRWKCEAKAEESRRW